MIGAPLARCSARARSTARCWPGRCCSLEARFLSKYDNLLVSHADRSRIVAKADRARIMVDAREIVGTVLVDGFAGGTWKIHRKDGRAVLAVAPFARLARGEAAALTEEGERLLAFTDADASAREVRIGMARRS